MDDVKDNGQDGGQVTLIGSPEAERAAGEVIAAAEKDGDRDSPLPEGPTPQQQAFAGHLIALAQADNELMGYLVINLAWMLHDPKAQPAVTQEQASKRGAYYSSLDTEEQGVIVGAAQQFLAPILRWVSAGIRFEQRPDITVARVLPPGALR